MSEKNNNGAAGAYAINLDIFRKRLKMLYSHWNEHKDDMWGSSQVLTVATPPQSDDLRQKKASLLGVVKGAAKEAVGAEVVVHVKAKNDDGGALMDSIFRAVKAKAGSDGDAPVVGHMAKEAPEGNLLEKWAEKLQNENFMVTDISNGFSDLFAVKDISEITNVKKAAYLTSAVMKLYVVPKLEQVIDEEKKVSHSSLMDETEKVIVEPAKIKVKLKAENVDICYPPIFQSGGEFDLRPSATSNDHNLFYESTSVILCAIGSRYSSYCSNVARTFLIDANPLQSKAYGVLLKAQEAAINALKPGRKASAAYQAALSIVEKEAPDLAANLSRTAGTGIGLEFRESGLNLNGKNDKILKAGMVFNVSLGFQNLQTGTKHPKTQNISMLLADTVVIGESGPEVLTSMSSKAAKDVLYSLGDEEDDEEEEKQRPKAKLESNGADPNSFKTSLRSLNQESTKEELRRLHQAELARQKNEETARRLTGGDSGTVDSRGSVKSSGDIVAYKNVNDLPPSRGLVIQIDQKNEAILLPIYGSLVPFHVATVKSVTSQQDTSRTCYIRIIFNVPGTPFNPHDSNTLKFQGSIYVKELSFRSRDPRHSSEVVQLIKTLRRQVASRESERAERATLVSQEKLQITGAKFKPIRLSDLWIRPVFGGRARKLSGSLEAHTNGFRYSTSRAEERVDVMYANIKHAFFQPAEKEMITLLHFHLHNHIMVGNKKTKDVQFYCEVMDVAQTIGGGKRSAYDPDEIEEEQRERARKNKINLDFQNFVTRVNDLWGQPQFKSLLLEFDQPLRELGFHGVPHKSSAFIVPTSSCLVELIETPFVVISLSEIEIVNLERVGLGQKNFDMAVVFKDFKRDVFRIDSIPSSSLDGIKEWLDTTDIKYYESRLNMNWKTILKTITDDPQQFIDEGGWEFLNLEVSDSDSEKSQESDQGYEPSDVQSESESEEDDSDSASLVESEEDEVEESEQGSEEEEGKTWDELEKEATNADRERGAESDRHLRGDLLVAQVFRRRPDLGEVNMCWQLLN
ncbi:FACT complex subunit [Heracleum sosnowskyi]|uniref:FACT complex subunit n=1 Tax=Heracleum sosnowskyi TaxID=360622 RepID=A0AAD8HWN1_9APIA|nr:FACT complex subunit [Heracleum sosnowskyi]